MGSGRTGISEQSEEDAMEKIGGNMVRICRLTDCGKGVC